MNFLKFFKSEYWVLKQCTKTTNLILKKWEQIEKLNDEELKNKTLEFKNRLHKKERIDDILPEAFAVICEAIRRKKGFRLHKVQIIGGIILHNGNVAEMKTGEGKTLTALLPIYLNALTGDPVYIVTVNEYLVKRDKEDNEQILGSLGITVGNVLSQMDESVKKINYEKNVIYATNSELGFDYLRDNMKQSIEEKIQKKLSYVIVDEVDSVLIDEAQTPLIISGKPKNRSNLYKDVDNFVKKLQYHDYVIDRETQRIFLNKKGVKKVEVNFKIENLYSFVNSELNHFINNALHANFLLQKNIDYVVRNNKIFLIDKFTGRIMEDRSLSEGLHQSLEAKEGCEIKDETAILATVTYQNFFRLFSKISGMTGTAMEEKDEFMEIYNMHVISVPTNLPIQRKDLDDLIFYDKKHKYLAVAKSLKKYYEKGQPVLLGTNSVEISEEISFILKKMRIPHNILNAKRHEYEASIIKEAGKYKSITIATNMAGRGTDIKLDKKSEELGGLALISLSRNDSRRIDLQLIGRSGRQGQPGLTQFYLSLDDVLFLRFGSQNLKSMFLSSKDSVISSKFLTKIIKKAQNKLQNMSFEQRKSLLEFDNIIAQQRRVIYKQRDFLMSIKDFSKFIYRLFNYYLNNELKKMIDKNKLYISFKEMNEIYNFLKEKKVFLETQEFDLKKQTYQIYEVKELFFKYFQNNWKWFTDVDNEKIKKIVTDLVVKKILVSLDKHWTDHLDEILKIKSASFLHAYAQKRPLQQFIEELEQMFLKLKDDVAKESMEKIFFFLNNLYLKVTS